MVSARKIGGRRLYELAREGTEVEREARAVTIHSIEIVDFAPSDYPELSFSVICSTGTYVRTLADDIARALGGRAHLTELRRTANGSLDVRMAHDMPTLEALAAEQRLEEAVMSPADGLCDMAAVILQADTATAAGHGVSFAAAALGDVPDEGPVRMIDSQGELVAVYRLDRGRARPDVVLA